MDQDKQAIEELFRVKNSQNAGKILSKFPNLDLQKLRDKECNSLVHLACCWNKHNLMMLYLGHQKYVLEQTLNEPDDIRNNIQAWINEANSEGFTPLHYAAYNDNMESITRLLDLKANWAAVTKSGLNVLHLAAQADALNSFLRFKDKLSIFSTDNKGMTPLHWAAYSSSQRVTDILISLKVGLDIVDSNKETPLHLAAHYGNTRIVRRLLLYGANRNLRNASNQTALDISHNNEFVNISRMLNNNYSCLDYFKFYLNIQVRYEPQDRNWRMPILFVTTLVLVVGAVHTFLKTKMPLFPQQTYFLIPVGFYYILLLSLYMCLLPGPQQTLKPKQYAQLVGDFDICAYCKAHRPDRAHHCEICKTCILRYDHHCPWINGCVGQNNLKRFILFLLMLLVALIECSFVSLTGLLGQFFQYRFQLGNPYDIIVKAVLWLDFAICIVFIFPIISLVVVQLTNMLLNQTTYERYSKSKKMPPKQQQSLIKSHMSEPTSPRTSLTDKLLQKDTRDVLQPSGYSCSNCAIMCTEQPIVEPQTDH